MQQSGFNDMQILQQTIMFKQLQELQRRQLQQLGDPRQQDSINQFSAISQQAAGGQIPLFINGTPVSDSSSQAFMSMMQRSSSPAGKGIPKEMAFPRDQNQSLRSMGLGSQHLDLSLHGAPVGSAGGIVNQYAHMQGMSRSSGNMLNKHVMPSTFSNPFPGEHDTSDNDNASVPQGAFTSKYGFPVKNAFGQGYPQLGNIMHTNASFPNYNFMPEQIGNLETMQQTATQSGHPQSLIPLDPLEQKILYNLDDNSWDASFGRSMDRGAGSYESALEQSDYSSELQSGSWSALMQTAVAEASSCDTGVQEEWSGLTFQSTELLTDNQPFKFMDEEKQQTGWASSNLQSASSESKPFLTLNDSNMSSGFPGFQQSGFQNLNGHDENLHHYDSHKSFQKSPGSAGEWSDCNLPQKSYNQGSRQIQPLAHSENAWAGQNYDARANNATREDSNNSGQTNVYSNSNVQAFASGLLHVRSQFQTQQSGESSQAILTDTSSRFPPFNHARQYISPQASTEPVGQQFPAFESASVSQPSIRSHMSPKSGMSTRHQNTWKSVPASRLSSAASPIDPTKNSIEAASLGSLQGRTASSDLGACSTSSQGSEYGEQPGKHRFRQEVTSAVIDTLQSSGLFEDKKYDPKRIISESNQKESDNVLACSERNLESFGQSLEISQTSHKNDTLLHQMQAMKSSAETDSRKTSIRRHNEADSVTNVQQISDIVGHQSIYEQSSRFRNQTHVGEDVSRLNSYPSGDPKMPSFLTNTREELGGQALSQPTLQPLQGIDTLNQSQNQTKGDQVSMHMAPTWFKQYGTFRNGHMQPMHDALLAKTAVKQFTGKSFPNLLIPFDVDQRGLVVPGQAESISLSRKDSLAVSENFSSLDVLPSDLVEQIRPSIRAKKRKSIESERIPWHKEVTQGSQRLQDISTAEQDWACATSRLTEKIEDGFEMVGEEQPGHHRSKRRLILTTQLIQQLLRPAPPSVLLGDASSRTDMSATYFVARLALGDACSLTYDSKKYSQEARDNSDMIPDKLQDFESYKHFTQAVEDFTERAKKLENDFLRLENPSILDIQVDCQDLERYSVINRFAKFHMRGQVGAPGITPQKSVTALPMPRNPPDEAHCCSL